jgi:hypothetical protein
MFAAPLITGIRMEPQPMPIREFQKQSIATNMGIVYVVPVQNKAGIHFMVNLSDHEVQCHNNKNSY